MNRTTAWSAIHLVQTSAFGKDRNSVQATTTTITTTMTSTMATPTTMVTTCNSHDEPGKGEGNLRLIFHVLFDPVADSRAGDTWLVTRDLRHVMWQSHVMEMLASRDFCWRHRILLFASCDFVACVKKFCCLRHKILLQTSPDLCDFVFSVSWFGFVGHLFCY